MNRQSKLSGLFFSLILSVGIAAAVSTWVSASALAPIQADDCACEADGSPFNTNCTLQNASSSAVAFPLVDGQCTYNGCGPAKKCQFTIHLKLILDTPKDIDLSVGGSVVDTKTNATSYDTGAQIARLNCDKISIISLGYDGLDCIGADLICWECEAQ